jgi:hypothetical protein
MQASQRRLPGADVAQTWTTTGIARMVLSLGFGALVFFLSGSGGLAQNCTSNANCGTRGLCVPMLFIGNRCVSFACASSAQCPPELPVCVGAGASAGICTSGSGGGGGGGGGLSQSGEGGACGPRTLGGGVVKSIGCKRGLQCVHGRCQQLR